jgi:hypothetical protein
LAWARLAATVSDRVWWAAIRWERHGMVLRAPTWHALATEFSLWALAAAPLPPALARAGDAGRLRVAL